MKLWLVRTGECLKTWEFTTAVKRVAWSEDGSKVRFLLFLLEGLLRYELGPESCTRGLEGMYELEGHGCRREAMRIETRGANTSRRAFTRFWQ